ncbi:MAG: VWA domain-containing protein [Clostridiales bacterium]|nr:VWA domain-containing protein [Clostridiales bacterium]
MQWLNPMGAWAFLALIPVIALYLLRKRAARVNVPSLLLWRKTIEQTESNKPFEKLKSQLLLWLQLLLVILLALALMRPATVGNRYGEVAMIFDLSASMQTLADGNQTRLDQAKEEAYQILGSMHQDDVVTILAAGQSFTQAITRSSDHAAVKRAIAGLTAQNSQADVEGALSLTRAMRRDLSSLDIMLFTDQYSIQATDLTLISVGQSVSNRSIISLRLSEQEDQIIAFAQVQNRGDAIECEMLCYADGALCDIRTVSLEANATQSVRFTVPSIATNVMVSFSKGDALSADDVRYAVKQPENTKTILLASDGNVFLEQALSLREGYTTVKSLPADAVNAADFDLYVYDGFLPEILPQSGSILSIAPTGYILGITPGDERSDSSAIRKSSSAISAQLTANLLLSDIAIQKYMPLTGGDSILSIGNQTLLAADEQNNRRIAVLGFDLHDSNFPLKADFPILIQNLLSYLLPDTTASILSASCGEYISPVLDDRTVDVSVRMPDGQTVQLVGGVLTGTKQIGLYTISETLDNGETRATAFALHPPLTEGDTQTISESYTNAADPASSTLTTGREWTPYLLLLCFIVLMLEWEVSRRGV